ncbi:fumarate hydratase [candidate division KSB1 bacterium]|nr:fumarate hydratase [candidate division KSB1 bacterium]RQW03920.1 MAG: fumarate hydratase [candidate division KSB1 bacterium]
MHKPLIQHQKDAIPYRLLSRDFVKTDTFRGQDILSIDPEALTLIAYEAFKEISFYLRPSHLQQLRAILDDPEASDNDRFVAISLLKNAAISAARVLPLCQDTGTAIIQGRKGQQVWTGADDAARLSEGVYKVYQEFNLRYSQLAPLSMLEEQNTNTNLPAEINLHAVPGEEYQFLFIAKGGGSANRSFLFQQSKSLLTQENLTTFLNEKIKSLGTAACPPYHIAVVIGGTSAEETLKTVKLASAKYYDDLPTSGDASGRAFRDLEWEARLLDMARKSDIGAQFGGVYLALDIRVIRLPRHAASCPVGIGVSCNADRNIKAKITRDGLFIEQLERDPARYLSAITMPAPVAINLDRPIEQVLAELSKYPVKTVLSLTGTLIVARDSAHARLRQRLRRTGDLPDYIANHPVYYAGPAKKPPHLPAGSFGPTTGQRMDSYIDEFMQVGGCRIMIAKGERSQVVTDACKKYGGFYLGAIGGAAALLAQNSIKSIQVVDFKDLGMEAIRKITVANFPAVIVCDDKGNNMYANIC